MLKIKWFILIIFIVSVRLHAQDLQDWKTITYMNDVTDMVYSEGEIWVSTTGGVYQFNQEDSTYQTFTNIEGLGSLDLTSIETDRYNTVLASSWNGMINRYNRDLGLWQVYGNLSGEEIVDLYTHEDTLWVATNRGVGVFLIFEDQLEFRDFYINFPVMVDKAYRITVFNHYIYYATEDGLYEAPSDFIKNNLKVSEIWKLLTIDKGLPSNSVRDVVPTVDSLLVATADGAASINTNKQISDISTWTNGKVSIIRISDSGIFFIRNGDIYKQSEGSWNLYGQAGREITAGILDNFSNLWIGMDRNGIKKETWDSSFFIDGPASNHLGSIIKSKTGELWISSGKFIVPIGFGFYRYDFDHWTNYRFYNDEWYRKNNVIIVYEDMLGKIWYGSWGGGISIVDDESIDFFHGWSENGRLVISTVDSHSEFVIPELDIENRTCFSPASVGLDHYLVVPYFLEDNSGNLWSTNYIAGDGNYLSVMPRRENGDIELDCSNWTHFGRNIGFTEEEGQVSALEFDDFNRAWIATFSSGILVFDYNGTLENRSDDQPLIRVNTGNYPSLFSNKVLSIKHDQDGIMWIGTAGGLNSFDGQNFFKHVGEIGPIENKINAIFVDSFNNKWFATDGGLSILKADESPWDPTAWVHYTPENSGLPDKIVNTVFVDQNIGEAYIGTESGLSIYTGSFAELKREMNSVVGGPSPYVLDDKTDYVIKNLVFGASVKILNVNGRLVRTLSREEGNIEGGRATWDGRDESQAKVSSGIYIYLIYNEEGVTASGKIAVVNP
jgi:ligand-binding sensor domain-containing protein